jgi:MFS family permease
MSEVAQPTNPGRQASHSNPSTRARSVFWVMFSISLLNYLDRYVFNGGVNVIAKELHFDLSQTGLLSSAFLVVYTIFALPVGYWADKVKRKNVVAWCVALWSVATALTAFATNFTTLFLARMLLGIGEAGYFPAGTALLSDYYSRSKRSRVMSTWGTAQLFGILIGMGAGGAVAGLYIGSWRLAFIFTGIPGLILAYLAWRMHEPRRNQADEEELALEAQRVEVLPEIEQTSQSAVPVEVGSTQEGQTGWTRILRLAMKDVLVCSRTLLRIKTLSVLIAMQIFAFFVLGVNTTFLSIYLQQKDTFGFTSGLAGIYSGGIIVLAGIVGTLVGGYASDMLNRRHAGARVLVCGIGFLLSVPAYAVALLANNLVLFTIFFILTAFLLTIYTGPSTAATQDVVPSRLRSSAIALSLLIAHMLGDAFAPTLVGVMATSFDPTGGEHFRLGMAGHDLATSLLYTCLPALFIAGLIGVSGARWMAEDIREAQRVDAQELTEQANSVVGMAQ